MAQEHTGQEHTGQEHTDRQDHTDRDETEEARAAMADAARTATKEAQALASSGMKAVQETVQVARNGLAERTERTGQALHQAAQQLGGPNDPMGGLMESAAARLNDVTRALREGDLGSMVSDMESFARRQPAVFLAGAAILGFAIARIAGSGRRNGKMMHTARERMEGTGETFHERGQEARSAMEERFSGAASDETGTEAGDYGFGQGRTPHSDPLKAEEERIQAARPGSRQVDQGASSSPTFPQAPGEPESPARTHPSQPDIADPEHLRKGAQPQKSGRDTEPRPNE